MASIVSTPQRKQSGWNLDGKAPLKASRLLLLGKGKPAEGGLSRVSGAPRHQSIRIQNRKAWRI